MEILEKFRITSKLCDTGTKVKLVRDDIGGLRMATENDEVLQNVFVKEYKRLEGSVTRVSLEVIYIAPDETGSNW